MLFQINELQRKAKLIRGRILEMVVSANKGHIGGAFSCSDIISRLYLVVFSALIPGTGLSERTGLFSAKATQVLHSTRYWQIWDISHYRYYLHSVRTGAYWAGTRTGISLVLRLIQVHLATVLVLLQV